MPLVLALAAKLPMTGRCVHPRAATKRPSTVAPITALEASAAAVLGPSRTMISTTSETQAVPVKPCGECVGPQTSCSQTLCQPGFTVSPNQEVARLKQLQRK